MRRLFLPALVLAVAAAHVAVLWLLLVATRPHARPVFPVQRVVEIAWVDVPKPRATPVPVEPRASTPAAARVRATPTRSAARPEPAPRDAIAAPAEAPAAVAAPPAPLILNSEATRRALRDSDRAPSFAERANQALNPAGTRAALDSRLSAGLSGAAHGDCMKGQFKGGDMGLLSLPALALAAARGECAR
jgi:hypothetical protein